MPTQCKHNEAHHNLFLDTVKVFSFSYNLIHLLFYLGLSLLGKLPDMSLPRRVPAMVTEDPLSRIHPPVPLKMPE